MRKHGEYKMPGGKLVVADEVVSGRRLTQVEVSGDFFLEPDSALDAIDAALCGLPVDAGVDGFAAAVRVGLPVACKRHRRVSESVGSPP